MDTDGYGGPAAPALGKDPLAPPPRRWEIMVTSSTTRVQPTCPARFVDGRVQLDETPDWPDGTRLMVTPVLPLVPEGIVTGHVIVVGFGLAGRCVADLLDQSGQSFTIVEQNPVTVETQRALGRSIVQGDAAAADTLIEAGLNTADILALTIPNEDAVLSATSLARRLRPEIYIIARTNYSSKGMRAAQLGADDVIKAEQAVAFQFYEKLSRRIRKH
jgi:hypothetical protein